jgi:hypothetical protein
LRKLAQKRIEDSQAMPIDRAIESGDIAAETVYQDQTNKILTQEFAQGRVDDVAQKLDMYSKGLGDTYRNLVDTKNTTMDTVVQQGLDVLDRARVGKMPKHTVVNNIHRTATADGLKDKPEIPTGPAAVEALEKEAEKDLNAVTSALKEVIQEQTQAVREKKNKAIAEVGGGDVVDAIKKAQDAVKSGNIGKEATAIKDRITNRTEQQEDQVGDILDKIADNTEAREKWEESYQEDYDNLTEKIDNLQEELQSANKDTEKAKLEDEITDLELEQSQLEESFVDEYNKEQERNVAKRTDEARAKAKDLVETNKESTEATKKEKDGDYKEGQKITWNGVEAEIVAKTLVGKEAKYKLRYKNKDGDITETWTNKETLETNAEAQKLGITAQQLLDLRNAEQAVANAKKTKDKKKIEAAEKKLEKKKESVEKSKKKEEKGAVVLKKDAFSKDFYGGLEEEVVWHDEIYAKDGDWAIAIFNKNRISKDGVAEIIKKLKEKTGLDWIRDSVSSNVFHTYKKDVEEKTKKKKRSVTKKAPTENVAKLEQEMRDRYKDVDSEKFNEALGQILQLLDLAEAGRKLTDKDGNWYGVPSTFPEWIPEGSRTKRR